jgi:hypothetical protein
MGEWCYNQDDASQILWYMVKSNNTGKWQLATTHQADPRLPNFICWEILPCTVTFRNSIHSMWTQAKMQQVYTCTDEICHNISGGEVKGHNGPARIVQYPIICTITHGRTYFVFFFTAWFNWTLDVFLALGLHMCRRILHLSGHCGLNSLYFQSNKLARPILRLDVRHLHSVRSVHIY